MVLTAIRNLDAFGGSGNVSHLSQGDDEAETPKVDPARLRRMGLPDGDDGPGVVRPPPSDVGRGVPHHPAASG